MTEEINRELLNCDTEILYGKYGEKYEYIKYSDVTKVLDKYNNQPNTTSEEPNTLKENEIWHFGSRSGKQMRLMESVVKHIKDNSLIECDINIVEVPNNYKKAWEELYSEKEMPCSIQYMQELEKKYNLGE